MVRRTQRTKSQVGVQLINLTFQIATPRDALEKARREFGALQAAVADQDKTRIGDCLYNFAVSVYHVKDWVIEQPSSTYSKQDVEALVKATPALLVCRDVCNASKHRNIRNYSPDASSVLTSAPGFTLAVTSRGAGSAPTAPKFRLKIVTKDGRRLEVLALGSGALEAWDGFFQQHRL